MAQLITSGLVLHLETDQGLATADGKVVSWRDASGKGNDLTGSGDIAINVVTTPSGAPALQLDGDGDKLERLLVGAAGTESGLPTRNADRTVFFVVDYIDPQGTTAGAVYGNDYANQTFGLAAAPSDGDLMLQGWGFSNDISSSAQGVTGGFLVQSAVLSAGQLTQYRNGGQILSTAHDFDTTLEKLVIGEQIRGDGFAKFDVGAVLIYDRALSAEERAEVETYLQQKYLTDDGLNNAPVTIGESAVVSVGEQVTIDILGNDLDDGALDGSMVTIVDGPDHGSIEVDPDTGAVTYTHDGQTSVPDSFTYVLTDAQGAVSKPATVDLTVDVQPLSLAGFVDETVLTRDAMNAQSPFFLPISMAFLPDNRMLLLSKDGEILIVDPETGSSSTFMKLNNIDSGQERGLLDITLDPDFATNGHFYLYYTPDNPENARISRFTYQENSGGLSSRGALASEFVVWEDTDGYLACCHYGGGLDFGPDGKIWMTTSDKFQSTPPGEGASGGSDLPIDLTSSSGKIIRVNVDGSVPDGDDGWAANPYADPDDGFNDYIWGYGLRNPFRARFDDVTGNMYIGEVGGNQQNIAHEDLHLANLDQAGAFYGWPMYEGANDIYVNNGLSETDPASLPQPDGDIGNAAEGDFYSTPIWSLPHNGKSASLTGGEVYRGDMFPTEWDGVYFYGDYTRDYIRYLILNDDGTSVLGDFAFKPSAVLPGTTNEVVAITVGNDGALYYAMIASGEVHRVTYTGGQQNVAPQILSTDLAPLFGDPPLSVTFEASVFDADGDDLTYTVNFGDGTVITAPVDESGTISIVHLYEAIGRYNVSFSVSDPFRTALSQTIEVKAGDVNEEPEIANLASAIVSAEPGATEVTFTAAVTDPDAGDELTYTWHFGDGNAESGLVPADGMLSTTHVYTTDGSYQAYLEVTDGPATVFSSQVRVLAGPPTEVPVTDGLVLLLQSDIKIGLGEGNAVLAWLDGSGQGNNLFAEGDPRLEVNRTPTGQSAIVFDGVDDLLQRVNATDTIFNLPVGSADRTVFLVVDYKDTNATTSGLVYGDGANNEAFGLVSNRTSETLQVTGYGTRYDFNTSVDADDPGFIVQSVVLDDNVFRHFLNGTQIQSRSHTFATDLQKLILGAEIAGQGESELEIAAALVFDRALTETERSQVETFLQNKYITGFPEPNVAPMAADDSFAMDEDAVLSGNVLADNGAGPDEDENENDVLSVTLVTDVAHGTLTLGPAGTFSYRPDANFSGTDSFVYEVSDGRDGTDRATVTIDVAPVNDLADAVEDAYETQPGATLTVAAAAGVLANDTDVEGDPLTATLVEGPANGTLTLNADGSFEYMPAGGFEGTDSFTYRVEGGDVATVSILVSAPNVDPVAADDGFTTDEDTALSGNVLADNGGGADSDGNGDALMVTLVSDVANGTLTLGPNGNFGYTPDPDFSGTDSFVYEISDGRGGTDRATVTITVAAVDDPADAMADAYETQPGTTLTVAAAAGVLANDIEGEGAALTATLADGPANGTLTLNSDGSFSYTPDAGFDGQDSFTYAVPGGDTATVTIDVRVPSTNLTVVDGLVAAYQSDENVSVGAGDLVTGWLDGSGRGNDLVAAGDPRLVAGATPNGQPAIVFDGVGDLLQRINATDSLNGLPSGAADRTMFFVVKYIDAEGLTTGLVYGDGARNESFGLTTRKDGDLTLQGWGGGSYDHNSNVDGQGVGWIVQSVVLDDNVTRHFLNGGQIDSRSHTFATDLQKLVLGGEIAGKGESKLEIASALIYNRALTETERADVEAYLQNKFISGTPVPNTTPVAADDSFATDEDTLLSGSVLADNGAGADSDGDGDPLAVSLVTDVANGTLTLGPDGSFGYTPDANFSGTDSFVYEIADGRGGTDRATVTIDVAPVDDPADAVADAYETQPGATLTVAAAAGVLANDTDVENDPLTATLVDGPTNGSLTLNADGSFTYAPDAGFTGEDGFTYAVEGGDVASVSIFVSDPNVAPVAADDGFAIDEDTSLQGNVLADNGAGADSDGNGDTLAVTLVTDVANGTLALNPDGSFDYVPDADFFGTDSFVYEVSDGRGGTDQATATINVDPVDDPAVAVADSYGMAPGEVLEVAAALGVLANDTDVEGDTLTATLVEGPANGSLTLNADGSFSYAPDAGFTGTDEFTYAVEGGDTAAVSIEVSEPGSSVPVLAGLVAAFQSGSGVGVGAGNLVTGWSDGSGLGNDLFAAGDPRLVAGATPTGQSAIVFDGTGDLLQRVGATDPLSGLPGGSADRTMFLVVNYLDAEGVTSGLVYGDGASNEAFGLVTRKDGDLTVQGWGTRNDFDSNVDGQGAGWIVQSVVLDDNAFRHFLNGTQVGSGNHSFATDVQSLLLGGEIAGLGESSLEIAAAFIYDRALSDAERLDVEDYLHDIYIDPGMAVA